MSKVLNILIHPDENLRKKSLPINEDKFAEKDIKSFSGELVETMLKKDGVGLAAPQVGQLIRMIAVNTKEGPIVMINPSLFSKSWLKEWGEEGCLSVPNTFGKVKRHKKINCTYTSIDGQKISIEAIGLMARILQHEVDHLDGILFIDKAKDTKKLSKQA